MPDPASISRPRLLAMTACLFGVVLIPLVLLRPRSGRIVERRERAGDLEGWGEFWTWFATSQGPRPPARSA